ncbi:unnamed protein product [Closterium sp. Yama58-4]|nr:unnamed protein product [Closterium sp. Yama58-4]
MAPPHILPLHPLPPRQAHPARFRIAPATHLSAVSALCLLLLSLLSAVDLARAAHADRNRSSAASAASATLAIPASSLPSASSLHPFFNSLNDLSGDSGDSSHPEQSLASRSPIRLLVAQQQPSDAAAGVAKSAPLDDPSPSPPPPLREVELDSCALQALLPQLLPPALLDPACFNHLALPSAQPSVLPSTHETPAENGGGGGDESSALPPETATRRDLLDVARNKARASTVWAPLEGAGGSAEGGGGAGETGGGAGGLRGPGRAEPVAASTLNPPNEVITVCRSAGRACMVAAGYERTANYIGKLPDDHLTTLLDLRFPPSTVININLALPLPIPPSCAPPSPTRTANYIGKLPDDQLTTLLDLLFSPATSIGFNLARYLLGASFNASNSPQLTKHTFHHTNLPGYKPTQAGPYDWTADWRQRKVLKGAVERGVDEVEAIAYSPPWWMTISGDTAGNVGGASNLSPDRYDEFAEYLATIVDHFHRKWNVTFSTMNPANEPLEGWWSQGGRHEGCSYTAAELDRLCTAVARALQEKRLPTRIAGFDSFVGFTMRNSNLFSGRLLSDLKRISVHGYVPPPPTTTDTREFMEKLYVGLARMGMGVGKEVWVSEIGPMWVGGADTDVGLFLMRSAIQAINIMGASAWIYWQAINPYLPNNPNSAKWGLFTITHDNVTDPTIVPLEITFSKKFYLMKQMARASPRGSMPLRIDTSDGQTATKASFLFVCLASAVLLSVAAATPAENATTVINATTVVNAVTGVVNAVTAAVNKTVGAIHVEPAGVRLTLTSARRSNGGMSQGKDTTCSYYGNYTANPFFGKGLTVKLPPAAFQKRCGACYKVSCVNDTKRCRDKPVTVRVVGEVKTENQLSLSRVAWGKIVQADIAGAPVNVTYVRTNCASAEGSAVRVRRNATAENFRIQVVGLAGPGTLQLVEVSADGGKKWTKLARDSSTAVWVLAGAEAKAVTGAKKAMSVRLTAGHTNETIWDGEWDDVAGFLVEFIRCRVFAKGMAKKEELTGRFSSWASHAVAQSQLGVALLLLPLLVCVVLWGSFRARAPIAEGWVETRASETGSQADQWSVSVVARGAGNGKESLEARNENESVKAAGVAGVNRRWGPGGSEMGAGEARKGAFEATRESSRRGGGGSTDKGMGEAREGEARESTASLKAVDGKADGVDGGEEAEGEGIDGSVDGGGVKERGEGQGKARESAEEAERGGEDGGSSGGVEEKVARGGEGGGEEERSSIGVGKGGELEEGSAEGSEGGSEEGGQEGEDLLVGCEEMMNEGLSDSSGGKEGGEEAGEKGGEEGGEKGGDTERDERGEEGGEGGREDGGGKERDGNGEGGGEKGGEEEGGQEGEDLLVGCEEMMNEGLSDSSGGEEGGDERREDGGGKESGEGEVEEKPGDWNIGEAGGGEGNAGGADGGGVGVGSNATDKRSGGRDESNSGSGGSSGDSSGDSAGGVEVDVNGGESGGARNGDGGGDAGGDSNGGGGTAVGGAAMAGGARKKGGGRKEKIQLDVPLTCDLYRGSWVPDTSPPLYTNATCPNITRHQNCQGNGRPDSQYERWQWRPEGAGCALPRFDAEEFMTVMRGRGVLFVGDSVARNHFESLVCLLSQVEKPEFHGGKSMLRLVFRSSKVTLARANSAWLVEEGNDTVPDCPDSIPRLHLDRTSPKWFGEIGRFDVVMLSTAHWFVKPSIYMEKGEVIGSQGGWWKRKEPARVDNKGAFALAIRTVFQDVVKELRKNPNRVFVYRTFSPDHYEKGEWNTGGSCAGLTEPRSGNYTYNNTFGLNLYTKQLQAYNEVMEAAKEAGAGVDPLRFTLMDVMPSAGMRVDGHPGPYRGLNAAEELAKYKDSKFPPPQDCLHWCLPGPIDSWNVFLLQIVKRGFASIQGHRG